MEDVQQMLGCWHLVLLLLTKSIGAVAQADPIGALWYKRQVSLIKLLSARKLLNSPTPASAVVADLGIATTGLSFFIAAHKACHKACVTIVKRPGGHLRSVDQIANLLTEPMEDT
jgi:hypothetical protein